MFKLSKKGNTDVLFYKIYLSKLHENILKYYWYKVAAIAFNRGLSRTSKFPVKLFCLAPSSFSCSQQFCPFFAQPRPTYNNNQENCNLMGMAATCYGWYGRRNFLQANVVFSCLFCHRQSFVTRYKNFQ